ncbi:MAG: hypothetical protein ACI9SC_003312 [Gammaproteobacteria bacterium]|jgi:hypothetical protein
MILNVVGVLFSGLGLGSSGATAIHFSQYGAFIRVLVFLAVAQVSLVVGFLSSDKAVARI